MPARPLALAACLALVSPVLVLGVAPTAAAAGTPVSTPRSTPVKPYDVDGDGYPELVVGAPTLAVGPLVTGGVVVLRGSARGLSTRAQVITSATPGVVGEPEHDQQLGSAVTSADFDGDGYADLAVSRPVGFRTTFSEGAVTVLYGSADGLRGDRSVELRLPGAPQEDAGFAGPLASGDFDGDGHADLAVGAAGLRRDALGSGAVVVFPGSRTGLSADRSTVLRGRTSAPGPAHDEDELFGSSLAVGDVDADGRSDLVVGAPGYLVPGGTEPGSVSACYGGASGLDGCVRLGRREAYAGLRSVAVGDVTGTSRPEIVLGVPADREGTGGGTVDVLSLAGPRTSTSVSLTALTQASRGVKGSDRAGDRFGSSVALGDLDLDGHEDLVIGADGERVGGHRDAGRVTVVYGGDRGYRTSGSRVYDQSTKGVPGTSEVRDSFGQVTLLDHDADGHLDLSVGAPGENDTAGAVTLLRGSGRSFTTSGARALTLKSLGEGSGAGAQLGATLGR